MELSIVEYLGGDAHKCGYCKSKDSSVSNGMWAHTLTCEDYQNLIDRGWRRSGMYCYKPTMSKTCCPLYTIRCHSVEFLLNHSHKKVLKKVNKFLRTGGSKTENNQSSSSATNSQEVGLTEPEIVPKNFQNKVQPSELAVDSVAEDTNSWNIPLKKAKVRRLEHKLAKGGEKEKTPLQRGKTVAKTLEDFIHSVNETEATYHLEIKLVNVESPEFDATIKESHDIYVKYQVSVHQDKPEKCSMEQFVRFLVKSPLKWDTDAGPSMGYGSFHQQYWLNGKLIAVGVIDILPRCVSSVYFFYDPDYRSLSLGTYASLREIAFTRELNKSCPELCWYYLGFYIHTCPKMRYKGQYKPSWLLCPESYTWSPISEALVKLDLSKYARFADPSAEDEDGKIDLNEVGILYRRRAMTYKIYLILNKQACDRDTVAKYASLVGNKTARRMLLYRS